MTQRVRKGKDCVLGMQSGFSVHPSGDMKGGTNNGCGLGRKKRRGRANKKREIKWGFRGREGKCVMIFLCFVDRDQGRWGDNMVGRGLGVKIEGKKIRPLQRHEKRDWGKILEVLVTERTLRK